MPKNRVIFPVLLIIIAIIAYWQVAFFLYPLKFDIIDYYFPSRYIVGELLKAHILPLWNPYQTLGYPICADPQSGAWYPIAWVLGYVFGYSIYTVHFEFILHIIIAGFGMYHFTGRFNYNLNIRFLLSTAYMLSGLFVGNAQHLTWIISAAWIPLVLSFFIQIFNKKNFKTTLSLAISLFMLISGGYPAFFMILFYLLLAIFLYYTIKLVWQNRWIQLKSYWFRVFIAASSVIIMSAIIIVSTNAVLPFITRTSGVTLKMALFGPFSPQSMISFLVPFAAIKNSSNFYFTDLSMTNAYFGIILTVFTIIGLFVIKKRISWFFVLTGVVALLASWGNAIPFREFLYNYVPFMDMFRFPSIFRLFVIISSLIIAGEGLQYLVNNYKVKNTKTKLIYLIPGILILAIIACIIYLRTLGYLGMKEFILNNLFIFSKKSTIAQHLVFHGAIQVCVLALLMLLVIKIKPFKKAFLFIIPLVIFELVLSLQLNAPYTIYNKKVKVSSINQFFNTLPKGFPAISNNKVIDNKKLAQRQKPFWRNLNMLNKQIADDGFTPFKFNNYEYLRDSLPLLYKEMLKNPPVYLTSHVYPVDSIKFHYKNNLLNSKNVYLDNRVYKQFANRSKNNSIIGHSNIKIQSYNPNKIHIVAKAKELKVLVLVQQYFKGWKVFIDNKEMPIYKANLDLMCTFLPQGESHIVFKFEPRSIIVAYYISIFSFIMFFGFLLFMLFSSKVKRNKNVKRL